MYDGPDMLRALGVPDVGVLSVQRPSDLAAGPGVAGGPATRRMPGRPQRPAAAPEPAPQVELVPRLPLVVPGRLPQSPLGYVSPALPPWGAERIPVEGAVILRGASGAAANVLTAANAIATAEGLSVSTTAADEVVCSYQIPGGMIGIVTGYAAAPASRLGYDADNVSFQLQVGGRRTQLPQRRRGIVGGLNYGVLRVYRRNSDDSLIAINDPAEDEPAVGASYGFKQFRYWIRTPGGPATLSIQQYLKGSSTAVDAATIVTAGAGAQKSGVLDVTGEFFALALVNGATAQRPEVLVSLVSREDEVFASLLPIHYVAQSGTTVALLATNASTATWHVAIGALEIMLIERDLYRRFVADNV